MGHAFRLARLLVASLPLACSVLSTLSGTANANEASLTPSTNAYGQISESPVLQSDNSPVTRGGLEKRNVERGQRLWDKLQSALKDSNHQDKACDKSIMHRNFVVEGIYAGTGFPPTLEIDAILYDLGLPARDPDLYTKEEDERAEADEDFVAGSEDEDQTNAVYQELLLRARLDPTRTYFDQSINARDGIIIASANERGSSTEYWSDVVWYQWMYACGRITLPGQPTQQTRRLDGLKWVFRSHLSNKETSSLVEEKIEKALDANPDMEDDASLVFEAGSDDFLDLLGTPNGSGVARLLMDHRDALGKKNIKNIGIIMDSVGGHMWMELEG